jgi:OmpA-OmpF porin, OOP family
LIVRLQLKKLWWPPLLACEAQGKQGPGYPLQVLVRSSLRAFRSYPWPMVPTQIFRAFLFFTFYFSLSASYSQTNLVPNPSFEEFFSCPGSYNYSTDGKLAPGWCSPTLGTPDLFNVCSKGDAGLPTNWAGTSKAYSGMGYAGIYSYTPKGYREYLQTELTSPLVKGGNYYVEFFFKLSSNSKFSIDRIGFSISDSAHWRKDDREIFSAPTYECVQANAYTRATGTWIRCSYRLMAKGGERYLTIGNFSTNEKTRNKKITFSKAKEVMLNTAAYFYIDNVRVERTDEESTKPPKPITSVAGYPEIKLNETYILKNIFFDFDSYQLIASSFDELDNWYAFIKSHPTWKITLTGHTDERGTDEYNLTLSRQRVQQVAEYLASRGVEAKKMTIIGEGKRKPLTLRRDEKAHALNRRVEIRFSD